jgi:hypothetical protein
VGAVDEVAGEHLRPEPVGAEGELRHHPVVPAAALQRPQQIRVRGFAGDDPLAIGGHQLGFEQAVGRQSVSACQPAHSSAKGESGDPGPGHHADRDDQAVGRGGRVDVGQRRSGLHPDRPAGGVDVHGREFTEIQDDAAFAGALPGHVVAAPTHRQVDCVAPCERDRGADIGQAGRAHHRERGAVDHPVPHRPGRVESRVIAGEDLAGDQAPQLVTYVGRRCR